MGVFAGYRGNRVSLKPQPSTVALSIYLIIKYLSTKEEEEETPFKP